MREFLDSVLINRNYALFMGGSFVSATGSWFLTVTIGWLIWDIGKSEFLLGVANFSQMGPLLLLGLFGGVVADRVDRRLLLLVAQVVAVATTTLLTVLAATQMASVPVILALLLISGISQAFSWPAWSPFIADLVGPDRLRTAVALNSARFNLTRIIGPSLAGLLLDQVGPPPCLGIAAACQVGLLGTLGLVRANPAPRDRDPKPWLAALGEGLRCAWGTPSVRELMLVSAAMGLAIMPYTVFLPAFAQDRLAGGPQLLGLLFTSIGVGAIAGAVLSGTSWVSANARGSQGAFAATTGVFLAVFSLSTNPVLSSAALFFVGLGSIAYLSTANATVQLSVPREIVGRVIGLWVVVNSGTTPLGGLLLGAIAERAGLGPTLAAAGLLSVVFSILIMRWSSRRKVKGLASAENTASLS